MTFKSVLSKAESLGSFVSLAPSKRATLIGPRWASIALIGREHGVTRQIPKLLENRDKHFPGVQDKTKGSFGWYVLDNVI